MDIPAATPTTFGLRRVMNVRGAMRRRGGRWVLPVTITLGVFLGAMSCATSMAAGHGTHITAPGIRADHSDTGHGRHGSPTAAHAAESSGRSDGEPASSGGQAHPGMACVTSVQLRVPDLVVPTDVPAIVIRLAAAPPDRVTGPEPPVPRFS